MTPIMDQIITTRLSEIANLVPTQGISIDFIHDVFPNGQSVMPSCSSSCGFSSLRVDLSPQQLKGVNLLLKMVRLCCVFHRL